MKEKVGYGENYEILYNPHTTLPKPILLSDTHMKRIVDEGHWIEGVKHLDNREITIQVWMVS